MSLTDVSKDVSCPSPVTDLWPRQPVTCHARVSDPSEGVAVGAVAGRQGPVPAGAPGGRARHGRHSQPVHTAGERFQAAATALHSQHGPGEGGQRPGEDHTQHAPREDKTR